MNNPSELAAVMNKNNKNFTIQLKASGVPEVDKSQRNRSVTSFLETVGSHKKSRHASQDFQQEML